MPKVKVTGQLEKTPYEPLYKATVAERVRVRYTIRKPGEAKLRVKVATDPPEPDDDTDSELLQYVGDEEDFDVPAGDSVWAKLVIEFPNEAAVTVIKSLHRDP